MQRYSQRRMRAVSMLPDLPSTQADSAWRKRAEACERANWHRAKRAARIAGWADRAAILAVYMRANLLNLQVDHIYPLHGRRVSGLHVADNLRVVTAVTNMAKGCDSPDAESNY